MATQKSGLYSHVWVGVCFLILNAPGCDAPRSSGGGSHHDENHDEPESIRITQFSEELELFMEHPPLAAGVAAEFLCHFTVLDTGEPVREGVLTLRAAPDDAGPETVVTVERPEREGVYRPVVRLNAPGTYRVSFSLEGSQFSGRLECTGIMVHADPAAALAAAPAAATDPPDAVDFLMEQQWKIGMLLQPAMRREITQYVAAPGRIEAPQGAEAVIASPMAGRLAPPPGGRLPRLGDSVAPGQVIAYVQAPFLFTAEVSERTLDLRRKGHEVTRDLAQAEADLAFAESEFERLSRLHQDSTASDREYKEAVRELEIARAAHRAAVALEAWHSAAAERFAELGMSAPSESSAHPRELQSSLIPLVTPIGGRVVHVGAVAGETVDAHQPVVRIMDTSSVWLVADVSEYDLGRLTPRMAAYLTSHASPDRLIDVFAAGGRRVHVGETVSSATRTVEVRYEIPNPDGALRAGMYADVHIETGRTVDAVAIPEEAVVTDAGQAVVFVLLDGERFQRRTLVPGLRNRGWIEVRGGVSEGDRVVTRGAFALKQWVASPPDTGHGHDHGHIH